LINVTLARLFRLDPWYRRGTALARHVPIHVLVLRHEDPLVAEMVDDLPRRPASRIEPDGDEAPERIRMQRYLLI
jgi:hypothetical protein